MNNRSKAMIYAAIVGLIIVAIFLGFLSGLNNPVSWLLLGVLFMIPFVYQRNNKNDQLIWQDSYSVGVDVLDQDHKKLIVLLNQFSTAYDYAMSEEYERQTLEELVEYTKYHFAKEEDLMDECQYPDVEAHKKQHQMMIAEVERFAALYNEKGHDALEEVTAFLSNWLINHINGTDKQYTQYMNDSGIQ